ncbi:hypothetical protein ACH4ZX_06305 [Streptomyces sp. NPDC020490]|uniref:hypothetical protein n=1 Tax=Streptomyces sp. NPDC020490 TaxID=3365078 RepID=UPI00379C70E9
MHAGSEPTAGSLTAVLDRALESRTAGTARAVVGRVDTDGALTAARRLLEKAAVITR